MGSTVDGSVNSMTVGVDVVGFLVPSLLVVRPTFWVLELDSNLALAGYVDHEADMVHVVVLVLASLRQQELVGESWMTGVSSC